MGSVGRDLTEMLVTWDNARQWQIRQIGQIRLEDWRPPWQIPINDEEGEREMKGAGLNWLRIG